ncbi:hypothetical protein MRX96_005315 [Rhipicephalus microplus]
MGRTPTARKPSAREQGPTVRARLAGRPPAHNDALSFQVARFLGMTADYEGRRKVRESGRPKMLLGSRTLLGLAIVRPWPLMPR